MEQNNSTQRMAIINDTLAKLEESIQELEPMVNSEGFVVTTDHHIRVNNEGINGTGFALRGATSCARCAVIYASADEAYKNGVDYYLVDANNKPLGNYVRKASEVFREVLEETRGMMETFKRLANN